jgi:predicted nucleic acid-binding protein
MYLVDTNIFLEILLNDPNSQACETFLNNNIGNLCISDFSLHSIGVILFRRNIPSSYKRFIDDVMPKILLVTLPIASYSYIFQGKTKYVQSRKYFL